MVETNVIHDIIEYLVIGVETCGALVVILGVARSVVDYLRVFFWNPRFGLREIRSQLGQCMVMALEFQVAADILRTALSPTWNDIMLLAALIALRTLLNYLLERELEFLSPNVAEEPPLVS